MWPIQHIIQHIIYTMYISFDIRAERIDKGTEEQKSDLINR